MPRGKTVFTVSSRGILYISCGHLCDSCRQQFPEGDTVYILVFYE